MRRQFIKYPQNITASSNLPIKELAELRNYARESWGKLGQLLDKMQPFLDQPVDSGISDFGDAEYNQLMDAFTLLVQYERRLNYEIDKLRDV